MDFGILRPLIVPASYVEGGLFPAPHEALAAPDLALTWVELEDGQTMPYVTPERAAAWDAAGADWRSAALAAMRRADGGRIFTHEKRTPEGELQLVAMMHEDGLGSSRLLLHPELEELFPEGYWIALPDRSCGMAISRHVHGDALTGMREMVARMHRGATVPMLPELRDPQVLMSA